MAGRVLWWWGQRLHGEQGPKFDGEPTEKISKGSKGCSDEGRTLIIQFDTWLMLRPVAWQSCFFSSSLG
jgi:hypothetical protein